MRYYQKIPNLDHLLDLLEFGKDRIQDPIHHPEGSVLNHSLQVFSIAIREIKAVDYFARFHVALAALLHDIGKIQETKQHESFGATLIEGFVSKETLYLVKNHMRFWHFQLGEMNKLSKVLEITEYEYRLKELCLLARWDKIGRNPNKRIVYDRDKVIQQLISLL